jgi:hypothetical protein
VAATTKVINVDDSDDLGKKRTRSPASPFINLETALKRAKQFFDIQQRNAVSLKVAMKDWGYEGKSSGGLQTAATLISFGLMKDDGMGDRRKLQLTQNALRILLDQRPDSGDKAALIKQAALAPKVHQELWKKWGSSPPSDAELRHTLTLEWEPPFNEKTVDAFIKEYRDTIAFAKLTESDKVISEDGNSSDAGNVHYVPQVGDYVQWESQGVMQFKEPVKVLSISTDRTHVFVEGTTTGIPVNQLTRVEAPFKETLPESARIARLPLPLLPQTNMNEDVYSLPEGRIVVQWPTPLSAESVQEIKEYLKLLERKIMRSTTKELPK